MAIRGSHRPPLRPAFPQPLAHGLGHQSGRELLHQDPGRGAFFGWRTRRKGRAVRARKLCVNLCPEWMGSLVRQERETLVGIRPHAERETHRPTSRRRVCFPDSPEDLPRFIPQSTREAIQQRARALAARGVARKDKRRELHPHPPRWCGVWSAGGLGDGRRTRMSTDQSGLGVHG